MERTGFTARLLALDAPLAPVRAGTVAPIRIGPKARRFRWNLRGGLLAAGEPRQRRRPPLRRPHPVRHAHRRVPAAGAGSRAPGRAPIFVRGRGRGTVLLVLPVITWQGLNPADDDRDGFGDTLDDLDGGRGRARLRGRAAARGLPREVAPLPALPRPRAAQLRAHHRSRARARRGARAARQAGVAFPGSERWLTAAADLRLRRWVDGGGKLASFGTDSFRRRVELDAERLLDPSPPEPTNVFGERVALESIPAAPMVVSRDSLRLFAGTNLYVGLFERFEQEDALVPGAEVLTAAGRDPAKPAFVAYKLGDGVVVRAGSPEWNRIARVHRGRDRGDEERMGVPLAIAQALKEGGVVLAALAAAGAFLLPSQRARAFSALLALVLAPVLLVGRDLGHRAVPASARAALDRVAAAGAGLVLLVGARGRVHPPAGPAPPVRGGCAALPDPGGHGRPVGQPARAALRGGGRRRAGVRLAAAAPPAGGGRRRPAAPRRSSWRCSRPWCCTRVQCTYSPDFQHGLKNVVFFYVPFVLLLKLLVTVPWTRRTILACGAVALGLALVFVGIGFWEYSSRTLLWNPKVIESNQFEDYFRVNSLFFDPNIYGRYLALVMIGLATALLWSRRHARRARRHRGARGPVGRPAAHVLAVELRGAARGAGRARRAALAAQARGGGRGGCGAWRSRSSCSPRRGRRLDPGSTRSLDQATSGRFDLLKGGGEMFLAEPVFGFGSGSLREDLPRARGGELAAGGVGVAHDPGHGRGRAGRASGLAAYWRCSTRRCGCCSRT